MPVATSIGTVLQTTVTAALTTIAGVRNVEFKSPEVELFDNDDLDDTYVGRSVTGRTSGGSVSFSKFFDPAAATHSVLIAQINSPAELAWAILWSDAGTTQQDFDGVLTSLNRKAERGEGLTEDGEIAITSAPTLV